MHIESLRDYCLGLPEAEETFPFGPDTLVFKIHQKVFLLTGLEGPELRFNIKCDPDKAEELRATYPAVIPGFHMNKRHWNTVIADGSVPDALLRAWIRDSYDLVAPKKKSRSSSNKNN